jgi:hypothetical protein
VITKSSAVAKAMVDTRSRHAEHARDRARQSTALLGRKTGPCGTIFGLTVFQICAYCLCNTFQIGRRTYGNNKDLPEL